MSYHLMTDKFIHRKFSLIIYIFAFISMLITLYYARSYGLLPRPVPGTDQLTMLETAENIKRGHLPGAGYMYSYLYTFFLYILSVISLGNLVIMRILQAAVCALIPVFIYKLCKILRFGDSCGKFAAILYCLYGAANLISLSFLRAAPLALCFLLFTYLLVSAFIKRKPIYYFNSGLFMGMCVLGRENYIPMAAVPLIMLFYSSIRKHITFSNIAYYTAGILVLLLPVIIYNLIMFNSFSLIPGHWQNVMGAYHPDAAGNTTKSLKAIVCNLPIQAANFLSLYEIPNSLSFYGHREVIPNLKFFIVPFNFFTSLSLAVIFFNFRNKVIIFLAVLISAYAATMLPFNIFYRFRIPAVPLLCCLSSVSIFIIARALRKRKFISGFATIILVAVLFILTFQDSFKLRSLSEKRSTVTILVQHRRYHDALQIINKMSPNKKLINSESYRRSSNRIISNINSENYTNALKLIEIMPPNDLSTDFFKYILLHSLSKNGAFGEADALYKKWRNTNRKNGGR